MPGGNSLSAAASAYAAAEDSNVNAKQLPDGGDTLVAANGDDSGGVFMDVDGEDGKAGVAKEGDSSKAHVREGAGAEAGESSEVGAKADNIDVSRFRLCCLTFLCCDSDKYLSYFFSLVQLVYVVSP